ncbi:MAG: 3'-5' exonuclease [Candidatus Omnitrophica bacterium]|nr:3'-5' exonuclease [Candidatus Omnitrophota bacterium]
MIKDITFAFFDVETTGLEHYNGDKICEVAILKSRNGKDVSSFHTLINPGRPISEGAYAVNRITPQMLRGKPRFSEVAKDILKRLEGTVIVCHNAFFDMGFLKAELNTLNLPFPSCPIVDTLSLARRYFDFWSNSLGSIARSLGIEIDYEQEHRAMGDVRTTQRIFQRFVQDLEKKGIDALNEILSDGKVNRVF